MDRGISGLDETKINVISTLFESSRIQAVLFLVKSSALDSFSVQEHGNLRF